MQVIQILQDVGDDLMSRHDWNALYGIFSFSTTGVDPQSVDLPGDWDHFLPNASVWRSGSKLTPLSGPCPPDIWHRLLSIPGNRFPGYWRLADDQMQIIGAPSGETASIEYIGKNWILDADGTTTKNEIESDDDTFLLRGRLMYLGGLWNWKQSKGLGYAEDMVSYEKQLERDIAADRAARPQALNRRVDPTVPLHTFPGIVIT
jgi:hypothetical protein